MTEIQCQQIQFFLNDQEIQTPIDPELTALRWLREKKGLSGTKESCNEGDCGACTIALGRHEANRFVYRAVTSCILPATQLHAAHVITIEGLGDPSRLHLIQQKILEHHGTQCGYCTPGMVMSLFCLFSETPKPSREEILAALEGNLCRCTGYRSILAAAEAVSLAIAEDPGQWASLIFPDYLPVVQQKLKMNSVPMTAKMIQREDACSVASYDIPRSISELLDGMKRYQDAYTIIAGGTDLMVQANTNDVYGSHYLDTTQIKEFKTIQLQSSQVTIGCAVTFTELMENPMIQQHLPILIQVFAQMASQQIRNQGTLVGNIMHGSSSGDGICALMGLDATLVILSLDGKRRMKLDQFYRGYQKTALKKDEIVGYLEVPVQTGFESFKKTSKRQSVDIATLSSFLQVQTDNKGVVETCRIALGGFGPQTHLAIKSMDFLIGKKFDESIIEPMAHILTDEFILHSNKRGSASYRKKLIENHLRKHFGCLKTGR